MALNTFKYNYLTPLHFKGLNDITVVGVVRSSSQSSPGRSCVSRKNVDGTSSTDNELADFSSSRSQPPDQNTAPGKSNLPVSASDRATSGSDATVVATVEVSRRPTAVSPSPPREQLAAASVGHLPLSE